MTDRHFVSQVQNFALADASVVRKLIEAGVSDDAINEYLRATQSVVSPEQSSGRGGKKSIAVKDDSSDVSKPVHTSPIVGPGVMSTAKPKRECSEKQREALARGRATAAANRAGRVKGQK